MRRRWALGLGGATGIVAVTVAVLAAGSGSETAPAHEPLPARSLDGSNAKAGEFDEACGAAVDVDGDVFISDPKRGKIIVFDAKEAYLGAVANAKRPCELAVDSRGGLYVLQSDGVVVKHTPASYPFQGAASYGASEVIDGGGEAQAIAVDPYDDRLFVAKGSRIDVYKANGTLGQNEVQRLLLQGFSGGTFTIAFEGEVTRPLPYDATHAEVEAALARLSTIGEGNVSVREGTNGPADHFVTFSGALGASNVAPLEINLSDLEKGPFPQFHREGLVRGFSGHIGRGLLHDARGIGAYTYDGAKTGVEGLLAESPKLVSNGSLSENGEQRLVSFGEGGAAQEAGFAFPSPPVFINHRPRVYSGYSRYVFVADGGGPATGDDRIVVLAGDDIRDLSPIATIDGSETPAGRIALPAEGTPLAAGPRDGHFFLYDAAQAAILEFEATGAYVDEIADPAFSATPPTGIGVAQSGALYVAAGASGALTFGPLHPRLHETRPDLSLEVPEACGIAVDSHGNIYVSADEEIRVVDPRGEELTRIADPEGPCKLAVDSKGNLYAIANDNGRSSVNTVMVYEPDSYPPSTSTEYAGPRAIGSFADWLGSIAIDPATDHLFVNTGELSIAEYGSAEEGFKLLRDDVGAGLLTDLESYNSGVGVCGKNGHIYASGRGDNGQWRVYVFNRSGTRMLTRIDGSGSPAGPFEDHGVALAVDQSNCHFYIWLFGRRVEEYEASGTFVSEFGPKGASFSGNIVVDNGPSSPLAGTVYLGVPEGLTAFGPLTYAP